MLYSDLTKICLIALICMYVCFTHKYGPGATQRTRNDIKNCLCFLYFIAFIILTAGGPSLTLFCEL